MQALLGVRVGRGRHRYDHDAVTVAKQVMEVDIEGSEARTGAMSKIDKARKLLHDYKTKLTAEPSAKRVDDLQCVPRSLWCVVGVIGSW